MSPKKKNQAAEYSHIFATFDTRALAKSCTLFQTQAAIHEPTRRISVYDLACTIPRLYVVSQTPIPSRHRVRTSACRTSTTLFHSLDYTPYPR
ncbi:hypothetical protein CBOM_07875 [Ceraceosorus bombacis]|uniref:Uncharacterized protein n=1 Tax=Ceraceosorus bombacis TaxID=401625 RepID=A0A0P1BJ46_9BASI|nr:hypothetical protein CBOM_07875 [Ceraceosorus bombacis]